MPNVQTPWYKPAQPASAKPKPAEKKHQLQPKDALKQSHHVNITLKSPHTLQSAQTSPHTADPPRELNILLHNGHALGVDRAQIRILE
jgi:hypothetical protein